MLERIETRYRILLIVLLALWASGCDSELQTESKTQQEIDVQLEVDFAGKGKNILTTQQMPANSTVFQLLQKCQESGRLTFQFRGEGETVFVFQFGDIKNEGAAGSNWLFLINDKLANQSCGASKLAAGDQIRWKFSSDYP